MLTQTFCYSWEQTQTKLEAGSADLAYSEHGGGWGVKSLISMFLLCLKSYETRVWSSVIIVGEWWHICNTNTLNSEEHIKFFWVWNNI